MTKQMTCQQIFIQAANERRQTPLCAGRYKLEEVLWSLIQIRDEIRRIAVFKRRRGKRWVPNLCCQEDMGDWLKSIPERVAYHLGWKLLPAFEALAHNDVDLADIAALRPWLTNEVEKLLEDLECARQDIRRSVGREYARMKQGEPMLEPLLDRAIWLAEEALALTPSTRSCA